MKGATGQLIEENTGLKKNQTRKSKGNKNVAEQEAIDFLTETGRREKLEEEFGT